MKILVTGGAGFIASHIADALLADGHEVHIMDDMSGGRLENVPSAAVMYEMDIRSETASTLMDRERFDVLVHHAAQMDVRRSVSDPRFDADVNVGGLINLMEAGRRTNLQKVIFASTGGAIYGEPDYAPQDERHPLRPVSPYGISKSTGEKYLFFYEKEYGIPYVALRYGNVYGPRQNPHGEAGVVAIFSQKLLRDEEAVIYGDGSQTRDYVYVGDVVRANLLAIQYEGSGTFNVGTGVETSVTNLYGIVRTELAPDAQVKHAEARPGEQLRSVLDYSLAAATLGWKPEVSIEAGLVKTCRWFRTMVQNEA